MKTIKALLVSALLVLAGTVSAQSFSITFADVNVENGAGKLVASMTKDFTVAGWQMYLYLPGVLRLPRFMTRTRRST